MHNCVLAHAPQKGHIKSKCVHSNVGGRGLEYIFDECKCNVEVYICCDSFRFLTSFFLSLLSKCDFCSTYCFEVKCE